MRHGRVAALTLGVASIAVGLSEAPARTPTFFGDIQPLLRAHCAPCHMGSSPAAGLNLLSPDALRTVVSPRNPAGSKLLQRVLGAGDRPRMPLGFKPLTGDQISTIRTWIQAGAPTGSAPKRHWAYTPLKPVAVPILSGRSTRSAIDAFIGQRLQTSGLTPSPEASRPELIRRLSLDLIGLLPSPKEVDAFVSDQSQDAYEKVVDRLLASPHFGERQARWWLDLARYADSNGYEADRARTMWLYRDWVVKAFNANMPFDQFTIEQLAGDLLPNPSASQLIATGFNRNTMFNEEGGVDAEEAMYETLVDRVSTTAQVWMGQTLQCARCHDHKYDPFTQRDFFRFYAFFNNNRYEVRGDASVGQRRFFEPMIEAPTVAQGARLRQLALEEKAIRAQLSAQAAALQAEEAAWLKVWNVTKTWMELADTMVTSTPPVQFDRMPDGTWLASGANPSNPTYTISAKLPGGRLGALRLDAVPDPSFLSSGSGRSSSGNIILSRVALRVDGTPVALTLRSADFVQSGYSLDGLDDANGETGWALSPEQAKPHQLVLEPGSPVSGSRMELTLEFGSKDWVQHALGRFRVLVTDEPGAAIQVLPARVRAAIEKQNRTVEEQRAVDEWFRMYSPTTHQSQADLARIARERQALAANQPTALIMRDKPGTTVLRATVRHRGEFLSPEGQVSAGTPSSLPPMQPGRADRLSLARWLVAPTNPLTARVQVNRIWEQFFGRGLVETSENFGTQGSKPTHPELLDWLAGEYIRLKWNMKALMREIVLSATYRQSSRATAALLKRDPENRLLARGPRFRLDAEAIRDVALCSSGLLDLRMGGPSVFPSQPEGIWNSPYNGERWVRSPGGDSHRRSIYTYWKRTAPYPAFTALDAATRESCVIRRIRTNTPLQALALLNDPAMLEAAAALGRRARREGGKDPIGYAFKLVCSRIPTVEERSTLVKLLADAKSRSSSGDRAWTLLGNVLLNLDEAITKG